MTSSTRRPAGRHTGPSSRWGAAVTEPTPGELLRRVRDGDEKAWVALTDRFTRLLWAVARGLHLDQADAEDAIQTTWLRLVENLDALREPEHVGAWLVTTARRECLATLRRRDRVRSGLDDERLEAEPDLGTPGPEDAMLRTERDAALWRAFCCLAPRCQRLLRILLADPPPTYAEVAAALDIPVGGIGPTRQRCLAHIRRLLTRDDRQAGTPDPGSV
jgi:RNA polymerase sigma factor (sigma-70 family)